MHLAERDIQEFRRIVAVLIALAALAERAGERCFPVRILVLAIVTRAEWPVRAFLAESVGADWPFDGEPVTVFGRFGEAAMIALRLRMLAAAVALLLQAECLADCCRIARPLTGSLIADAASALAPGCVPIPADTS